jgi:hypothetical protein
MNEEELIEKVKMLKKDIESFEEYEIALKQTKDVLYSFGGKTYEMLYNDVSKNYKLAIKKIEELYKEIESLKKRQLIIGTIEELTEYYNKVYPKQDYLDGKLKKGDFFEVGEKGDDLYKLYTTSYNGIPYPSSIKEQLNNIAKKEQEKMGYICYSEVIGKDGKSSATMTDFVLIIDTSS